MSEKSVYFLAGGVGSTVFGYAPVLLGGGEFSFWAILGSMFGGLSGIYLAYKFMHS